MRTLFVAALTLGCAALVFVGCGEEQGKGANAKPAPARPAPLEQGAAKRPEVVVALAEFIASPLQHEGKEIGIDGRVTTVVASLGQFVLAPPAGGG
ncbi:MAG: hypothetical protein RDV41_14750 [Planctomycetota bacterium]|nr:hypothetical protein [Planctomycetota bacterium]